MWLWGHQHFFGCALIYHQNCVKLCIFQPKKSKKYLFNQLLLLMYMVSPSMGNVLGLMTRNIFLFWDYLQALQVGNLKRVIWHLVKRCPALSLLSPPPPPPV